MALRFLTAGESHGQAIIAILEGMPAGFSVDLKDIQHDLDKRKGGAGRGGRGFIETDRAEILSGIRNGITIGSPIAVMIKNLDFANWQKKEVKPVTNPRPGHADMAGFLKYGFKDIRDVLERASARETAARVAVGAVCRRFLSEFNIAVTSHTIQIGNVKLNAGNYTFSDVAGVFDKDPEIRCVDKETSLRMKTAIFKAVKEKNTLGGVVEVLAKGLPPGLGSYVHFDRKLDGLLSQALMSIPSVKAVEIGNGIESAGKPGNEVHDRIFLKDNKISRKTNNAGGLEGGVTNGEMLALHVFHKPISTLGKPITTVDVLTKKETEALLERSDICVVPRAGIISEAMTAFVLAGSFLEKFGNDNLDDIKENFIVYKRRISKLI